MTAFASQKIFLLLLAKLRRVVLQDAAEYQLRFDELKHPVFKGKTILGTKAFEDFKEYVRASLERQDPPQMEHWPQSATDAFKHLDESMHSSSYALKREIDGLRADSTKHGEGLNEVKQMQKELNQDQKEMKEVVFQLQVQMSQEKQEKQATDQMLRESRHWQDKIADGLNRSFDHLFSCPPTRPP
ncbi:hypothetical protein DFQ26_009744, partial [Actinomortierella ambigua]